MNDEYEKRCNDGVNLGWNHPIFEEIRIRLQEQDDFTENPFQVEEGVVECKKCGSKRTLSTQVQVRSSDEGFTLLVHCVDCGSKWREN